MRRIAIAAAKGGTGKTTTAVSLAHALALAGNTVLLVDCDPRRNAALHFGLPAEPGLGAWLAGRPARAVEVRAGLRVVDSGGEALVRLEGRADLPSRFTRALDAVHDADFVILDGATHLGAVQRAACRAADEILMPVGADYLGFASVGPSLAAFRRADRETPRLLGLLATFYDPTLASARDVDAVLAEHFGSQVLQTRIWNSEALRAAPALRGTVFDSDPLSRGAHDYALLAEEIAARAA